MRKIFKKIGNIMIALVVISMLIPAQVHAAGRIEPWKTANLTVNFKPEETAAKDTEFRLYHVADVSATGVFKATLKFAKYNLSFPDATQNAWRDMTLLLQGNINADKIEADYTAKVDENGAALFEKLPVGLYLVVGDVFHANDKYYTPQPFMICLPSLDANDNWIYDVTAEVKYESRPDGLIDMEILKVWKDDDYSGRPKEIQIEVYEGNTLYKTITLNADNNWRCQLTDLEPGSLWSVKEKDVPDGYKVVVEHQTGRIVITNTLDLPDTPDTPDEPENPQTPTTPEKSEITQTGVLWWPVPMLTAVGLVFILLGYLRRRGNENE